MGLSRRIRKAYLDGYSAYDVQIISETIYSRRQKFLQVIYEILSTVI